MSYDSIFRPGLFDGQTIIVTGGGSGIGRCTAHELAALGAHVVLVGRKAEKLEKTAGEIVEDGGSVSWHACDIREEEAVKTLVANILAERGTIHHLVNNAGGQYPRPRLDQPEGLRDRAPHQPGRRLPGRPRSVQPVDEQDRRQHRQHARRHVGRHARHGSPGAARSGMENFTRTAAVEWGHAGVRVNAVAPGWIASSGMDTYEGAFKAVIPTLREHVPLKRIGSESEVAAAIVFLLSPAPPSSAATRSASTAPPARAAAPSRYSRASRDRAARTTASTAPTCPTY